jgi:ssDNA-binding Zn-finger/Zn-ribbon topoisomerase 1
MEGVTTVYCWNCGHRMELRVSRASGRKFLGCSIYPTCNGSINLYPDGGFRRVEARDSPEVEAQLVAGKDRALEMLDALRVAGIVMVYEWREEYAPPITGWEEMRAMVTLCDNLVELGEVRRMLIDLWRMS